MAPHALFEAHLDVRDLDRSVVFYRDVVGLELAYRLEERRVAFLWAGGRGRSMLGLWAGSSSPNAARLHLAFALDLTAVLAAPAALRAAGVEPLDFDGRPTAEACVIGWMPAASVFFRDPDGHLLEYIAMLAGRAAPRGGRGALGRMDVRRIRQAGRGGRTATVPPRRPARLSRGAWTRASPACSGRTASCRRASGTAGT